MLLPSCHTQLLLFQFVSSQLAQKRPAIPGATANSSRILRATLVSRFRLSQRSRLILAVEPEREWLWRPGEIEDFNESDELT
jgi:hypothetical protein